MTESPEKVNQAHYPESESSQPILNRRQFIGAGAAAAAALILPKSAQANSEIAKGSVKIAQANTNCTPPSLTPPSDTSFVQPNVVASQKLSSTDNYCTLTKTLNVVGKPYSDVGNSTTLVRAFDDSQLGTSTPALYPGPTLCVNPGDLMDLTINNNLNQANNGQGVDPNSCPDQITMNTPHCFDIINMHFHGLHVSPISVGTYPSGKTVYISSGDPKVKEDNITLTESSDDVLYELEPGKSHLYRPWLPKFHAPGTHWYHAHRHGSTAIQVAGGMVGALIVKEPEDKEICSGAADVVMIIQEKPQSVTTEPTAQENLDRGIYQRSGRQSSGEFHINGVAKPTLKVKQGEIHRWRIINANSTPRAFMNLELRANNTDGSQNQNGALQTLYRVAVDGITLYGKEMDNPSVIFGAGTTSNNKPASEGIPFAPGNRVDLLVDFRSSSIPAGTYTLWKVKSKTLGGSGKTGALATIEVSTTPYNEEKARQVEKNFKTLLAARIPLTGRPDYLDPDRLISLNNTEVELNTTPVAFQAAPGNFTIDKGKYDPENLANTQANLNSSQEWIIANVLGSTGKVATHPFHIHVNPFLVVAKLSIDDHTQSEINNLTGTNSEVQQKIYNLLNDRTNASTKWTTEGIDPTIWWDTFPVEPDIAYKIRHNFDDYWGTYVLHCHVLIHEDQGMMWNVQINDVQNKGANPCEPLLEPVNMAEPFTT